MRAGRLREPPGAETKDTLLVDAKTGPRASAFFMSAPQATFTQVDWKGGDNSSPGAGGTL